MDDKLGKKGLPEYDSGEIIGHEPVPVTEEMVDEWQELRTVVALKDEVMRVEKRWMPIWIRKALEQL